jgi:hypothetical protein
MRRLLLITLVTVLSGSNAGAEKPDPTAPVRLWLKALRDGNAQTLASLTALPFGYHEAWPNKQCTQVVKKSEALPKWLSCVRKKDLLLLNELRGVDDPEHLRLMPGTGTSLASRKLLSLAKASTTDGAWVYGFINGDGVTYEFLFHLQDDQTQGSRVSGLFIDAEYETG